MINNQYSYQKPQETYTIEQFIACQSDEYICYNNLSFMEYDETNNINYIIYNVLSDYIEEIKEQCLTINLDQDNMYKYKYKPKLLCYDIYGNGELAFIILIINDMWSNKQFTKNKILMPKKSTMNTIIKYIYNSNKNVILDYNDKDNDIQLALS